jgi:replicative DNA helicase
VFLLHSKTDEIGDVKNYYFFVAKNRNGRIGKVKMHYVGKNYKFFDDHIEKTQEKPKERKDWDGEESN